MQRLFALKRSRAYYNLLIPNDPINDIPEDKSQEGDITSPPIEDELEYKLYRWQKLTSSSGLDSFLLEGKDFFISYNPNTRKGNKFFHGLADSETSLIYEGKYYILNGDHRNEYEKLIHKGYSHCKMYYLSHGSERSMWSSDNDFVNLNEFYNLS